MGLVVYKAASYSGQHNSSRLTLLLLLDLLRQRDSRWEKTAKYYPVRELAAFGVEKLDYDYIRVRAPRLAKWGFMSARALQRESGRAIMGYRIEQHGKDSIERAPESAYLAAITRIYAAIPALDPGHAAQAIARKPKVEARPWTEEDYASAQAWQPAGSTLGLWAVRPPFGNDDWKFIKAGEAPPELCITDEASAKEMIRLYRGS